MKRNETPAIHISVAAGHPGSNDPVEIDAGKKETEQKGEMERNDRAKSRDREKETGIQRVGKGGGYSSSANSSPCHFSQ